jgi:uncharacterized DUF497 family protein
MRFEWDDNKNRLNIARHKVDFQLASTLFSDPFTAYRLERVVDGEERWLAIGQASNHQVLVVIHTYRGNNDGEIIRIISARYATSHERSFYEEG